MRADLGRWVGRRGGKDSLLSGLKERTSVSRGTSPVITKDTGICRGVQGHFELELSVKAYREERGGPEQENIC